MILADEKNRRRIRKFLFVLTCFDLIFFLDSIFFSFILLSLSLAYSLWLHHALFAVVFVY